MKAIRRILVGVKDPAAKSSPALLKAACLAEAFDAELAPFHAITVPVTTAPYFYLGGRFARFGRELRQTHLDRLERRAAKLRNGNGKLKVRADADWDYPAHEAIVRHAREVRGRPLVALGHAGPGMVPWLLHLTDWELLRTSKILLTLLSSSRPGTASVRSCSPQSTHCTRTRKAADLDAEIMVAGATLAPVLKGQTARDACLCARARPDDADHRPEPSSNAAIIAAASYALAKSGFRSRRIRKLRVPRSRRDLEARSPPLMRSRRTVIARVAKKIDAGIVVMGAVSRSGLSRVFIGNTAERLLGDLSCDVLVVKPARFVTRVSRSRRGVRYAVSTEVPMPY